MDNGMTFETLLEVARQQAGNQVDPKTLEKAHKRVQDLSGKLAQVQAELAQAKKELAELEKAANIYVRKAADAARALGLPIPEQYLKIKTVNSNGNRTPGKYYWESPGLKPFQAEISRAMWRLSHGSGGSAGLNGEGVLSADEFWTLVEAQTGSKSLSLGESITVDLPNGRTVTCQKVEE